jgi:anti-sigma B factor antagonist
MAIDAPLSVERKVGTTPGTLIFQLMGPVTLRNLFDLQPHLRSGDQPQVSILDMSRVPYMDSSGMGAIVNYYTHCQRLGVKLIVAGVNVRVIELFKMTRVDTVIPLAVDVEAAEAGL